MNPLDKSEFLILINAVKKELPFFGKKTVSMRSDNGRLPKNVSVHSNKLNERFLNYNSHVIDEIKHRDKKNSFVKRFENYQNKFFDIPNASCLSTASESVVSPYLFAVTACTPISTVNSATSGTGDQAENDQVIFNQMTSSVSVGECFDQIAISRGAGTGGTVRLGVYNQSGSAPADLLVETGSLTMPGSSTYTFQSLTETETDTAVMWSAFMQSTTTPKVLRQQTAGGSLYFRNSWTYGSLPDPAGSSASGNPFVTKIGHS
jgi:hypothetical protein